MRADGTGLRVQRVPLTSLLTTHPASSPPIPSISPPVRNHRHTALTLGPVVPTTLSAINRAPPLINRDRPNLNRRGVRLIKNGPAWHVRPGEHPRPVQPQGVRSRAGGGMTIKSRTV